MSVESELLAAIRAAPDDDAPRLVYADWLIDRGDPRGEFIALQCSSRDPNTLNRAELMLHHHYEQWTGHLPPWVEQSMFVRGFVYSVSVKDFAVVLAHHRELFAMSPVPQISLIADHSRLALSPDGTLVAHCSGVPPEQLARGERDPLWWPGFYSGGVFRVIELRSGDTMLEHREPRPSADGPTARATEFEFTPDSRALSIRFRTVADASPATTRVIPIPRR